MTRPAEPIALGIAGYTLRAWQPGDAPSMAQHLNNPNIGQNMADWYPQTGYTLAMAQQWCNGGSADFGGDNWAITWENAAIGSCGVHPKTGFDRCNAEIGYWLSEAHWGKGVGSAVVAFLTSHAFAQAHITRVFAPIHAHNQASQRVCEKNGFTLEGLRRKSVMKWGEAIDTAVWATYRG
jgi:[ribosomal protein S5]-alanine N-acetyltransferase